MPVWIKSLSLHVSFCFIYSYFYTHCINSPLPPKMYELLGCSPPAFDPQWRFYWHGSFKLNMHAPNLHPQPATYPWKTLLLSKSIALERSQQTSFSAPQANSYSHLSHRILSTASRRLPRTGSSAQMESVLRKHNLVSCTKAGKAPVLGVAWDLIPSELKIFVTSASSEAPGDTLCSSYTSS